MQPHRNVTEAIRPRTKQLLVVATLVLALVGSGVLVSVALTSHARTDLAGTVPAGLVETSTPTPTPTRLPVVAPTVAPAIPSPTPTVEPLPVLDRSPVETSEYVQFSESIPFGYSTQEDPSQAQGVSYVSVPGSEGSLLTTVQVFYSDGDETSRRVISQEVVSSPVDQITVVGTASPAPSVPDVPTPDLPVPEAPATEDPEPTNPLPQPEP